MCECHNVIKCLNGTSSPIGASSLNDCKPCCSWRRRRVAGDVLPSETTTCRKTGSAMVLRRYDLIPSHAVDDYNKTNFVIKAPGTMGAASRASTRCHTAVTRRHPAHGVATLSRRRAVVHPHYPSARAARFTLQARRDLRRQGPKNKCKAADEFADLTGKKDGEPGASSGT